MTRQLVLGAAQQFQRVGVVGAAGGFFLAASLQPDRRVAALALASAASRDTHSRESGRIQRPASIHLQRRVFGVLLARRLAARLPLAAQKSDQGQQRGPDRRFSRRSQSTRFSTRARSSCLQRVQTSHGIFAQQALGHMAGVALHAPGVGLHPQFLGHRAALGNRQRGHLVHALLAHREFDVAQIGDGGGVVEQFLAPLGGRQRLVHLLQVLDVELVAGKLEAVLVGHHRFGLDRQQRLVRGGVRLLHVMPVVGRHHADAQFLRPRLQDRIIFLLLGQPMILNLDVVVLAK